MPSNGLHSIRVFGSDSDGNIYQSEERFFIVEYSGEVSPPSVPGYPIGVIFISIMITVMGLVYLTKKH